MTPGGSVFRAATLAGLLGALLQATPFLNALNSCCCAFVVLVGAFAAWMLRSDSGGTASTWRCGAAGLAAGILSAIVGVPLAALLKRLAFGRAQLEQQVAETLEMLQGARQVPPGFEEVFEAALRATHGLELSGWLVLSALFQAFVQAFFGLLGGLLGAAITRRNPEPPSVPAPTPATPPPPVASPVVPSPPAEGISPEPPASPPDPGVPMTGEAPPFAEIRPEAPTPTERLVTSAEPVLDASGRPDVQWSGPVVGELAVEAGEGSDEAPETGDIPLDELPILPPRPEPTPDADPPEPKSP